MISWRYTQPILRKAFPWHGDLSRIVWELVERGHLGQKTGAGVYQYAPGDRTPTSHLVAEQIIADARVAGEVRAVLSPTGRKSSTG